MKTTTEQTKEPITNVSETLQERIEGYSLRDAHFFSKGANWSKQQSDTIIKELVEALELANGTLGSCTIMRKELSQFLNIENIQKDKLYISNIIEKANEYLQGKS